MHTYFHCRVYATLVTVLVLSNGCARKTPIVEAEPQPIATEPCQDKPLVFDDLPETKHIDKIEVVSIKAIIKEKCVSCHNSTENNGDYTNFQNVMDAGSLVYYRTVKFKPGEYGHMPKNDQLSDKEIGVIKDWEATGYQDPSLIEEQEAPSSSESLDGIDCQPSSEKTRGGSNENY